MITDSVAQLVEQYTFNVWVLGSNPSGITRLTQKELATKVFGAGIAFPKFFGTRPARVREVRRFESLKWQMAI